MITATSFKRYFVSIAAVALAAGSPGGPAWADPFNASETVHLTIDEDTLGASLHAFGKQSGAQILFSETSVSGRAGVRLDGTYTAAAALEALLNGTDLEAVRGQGNTFIIRHRNNNKKKETLKDPDLPQRISDTASVVSDAEADASSPEPLMVDKIIVTGTSLRGVTPESSPLQIYSRDDILGSGVTTTEQFIRTLPQNFGGGSTELAPSGLPGDSNSQFNNIFGSGANLRGLGSGGTLTLLNGNRLAPTSEIGDFVDLSLIPISALERVDVMTDGASSIYGGDAVAGVMNFVLRDDFEGAETAVRYGAVTQGNLEEYRLSQTLGTAWQSGNVIATYEYFDRDNLSLADRPDI
ncbi:MAG: TonB-dependent receptor plug domain-containing protein, partial [Alphaproteobacteria bacterium]|nr:TonB-dependent receptor plug domain-containing protein [Alphaproteobacteria bacterium]